MPSKKARAAKKKTRPSPKPRAIRAKAAPVSTKAWSGRLGATDPAVEQFTASLSFDRRLYKHDITGSIAHCQALHEAGLLSDQEAEQIRAG